MRTFEEDCEKYFEEKMRDEMRGLILLCVVSLGPAIAFCIYLYWFL